MSHDQPTHAECVKAALDYVSDLIAIDNVDPYHLIISDHAKATAPSLLAFTVEDRGEFLRLASTFGDRPRRVSAAEHSRLWATTHRDIEGRFTVTAYYPEVSFDDTFGDRRLEDVAT